MHLSHNRPPIPCPPVWNSYSGEGFGAEGRNRTGDTMIFSHVLYQLSYLGAGPLF